MSGAPESTIVAKYFERHATGPNSVAYHCIICAGRSMKDYTRHMNSKTHQDKIASFQAQLELFGQADCQVAPMSLGPGPGSMELGHSSYSPLQDEGEDSNDISTTPAVMDSDEARAKRPRTSGPDGLDDRAINNFISYNLNSDADRLPQLALSPPATSSSTPASAQPFIPVPSMSTLGMSNASLQSFNEIATTSNLDEAHREMARKACDVTGEQNRFYATMCYMTMIHQDLSSVLQARQTTRASGSSGTTNTWTANETFRDWARHNLAKLITDHSLEAYTTTTDANKQPIPRSFERLMMQLIRSQSKSFIDVNLPPGFGSEDPKPSELVLKVIKDLAKHARSNFRAILLMNILPESGKSSTSPVPVLKQIIGRIVRSHAMKTEFRTDDEIERSVLPEQRLRYAWLRMEAIHFHKCPESNGRRSQWSAIDERLAILGSKSYRFQETFYNLVLQRDTILFDGTKTYDQLQKTTQFDLPTDAEVEAGMSDVMRNVAPESVLQGSTLQ